MGIKPISEQTGCSFIQHSYQSFDDNKGLTHHALHGKDSSSRGTVIVEKMPSLPFQKIKQNIMVQDHQPMPDSCIISMVIDQLVAGEDHHVFHQMFLLKNIYNAWVCTKLVQAFSAQFCWSPLSQALMLFPFPHTIHTPPDTPDITQKSRTMEGMATVCCVHDVWMLDYLHPTWEMCVVPAHALERLE